MSRGYSTWINYSVTSVKDMRSDYDTFLLISFILSESIMLHVFVTLYKQKLHVTKKENCFARWELNLCHVPILSVHLPSFFLKTNMIVWLSFLRAMVLNRDPKVKSPRFETRSGKKTQRLPSCWGHPRESLEDEASLVLVRRPIEPPFVMSSVFSTPFLNGSIVGQL